MKILFFLGHPAHYHMYKYVMKELLDKNHEIKICIKTKDVLEQLLKNDNVGFKNILPEGRKKIKISILIGQLKKDFRLAMFIRQNRVDLAVGCEPAVAHIGKLLKIPSIIMVEDDTNVIPHFAILTYPFTNCIMAPISCDLGKWTKKKISYDGYQKLTYLHPKYFKPEKEKISAFFSNNKSYYLLRFSGLSAHHDFNKKGIDKDIAKKIIRILSDLGQVFITAEGPLDEEFKIYKSPFEPSDIHHAIYYSDLLISDSQSMTMEAAMLGVPSIRFSDFAGQIGVLEELEKKYELTYGIKPDESERLFEKLNELLNLQNFKKECQKKQKKMLSEKIDVTAFMVWFIENYPESVRIMKENPDYQYRFK